MRLVLPLLLALAACADAPPRTGAPAAGDTVVTDDMGRRVAFGHPPARIVPLAPSLTELAFAVGAGDRVVAVSPVDDFPADVRALPRVATFPLDHERVVAMAPDLLLATDQVNRTDDAEALAAAGVPTYFFRLEGPADVPRALRTAGRLLGTDGETPARAFERRLAAVSRAVDGAPRPRVLVLVGDETPYAFGLARAFVRAAGGANVTDALPDAGAVLSEEWVIEQAPEVVVVLADPYDPARLVRYHPAWRGLPAVRDGRVYGLDADLASRPGPRMAEGVERLAALLHPDRFPADAGSEAP